MHCISLRTPPMNSRLIRVQFCAPTAATATRRLWSSWAVQRPAPLFASPSPSQPGVRSVVGSPAPLSMGTIVSVRAPLRRFAGTCSTDARAEQQWAGELADGVRMGGGVEGRTVRTQVARLQVAPQAHRHTTHLLGSLTLLGPTGLPAAVLPARSPSPARSPRCPARARTSPRRGVPTSRPRRTVSEFVFHPPPPCYNAPLRTVPM
jgi:hypothetical protein